MSSRSDVTAYYEGVLREVEKTRSSVRLRLLVAYMISQWAPGHSVTCDLNSLRREPVCTCDFEKHAAFIDGVLERPIPETREVDNVSV